MEIQFYMVKKLLFSLLALTLVSCNNKEAKLSTAIWVGGEIVNPKVPTVILSKDDCSLDTVLLSNSNSFLFNNKELKAGLYSFQHYEYQMFFVEPGDSLMLRVNTVDFDESLTYTGRGAEKNNFLMELFLINEKENKLLPKLYRSSPEKFDAVLDSLKTIRMGLFHDFVITYQPSEAFKEIALANINYDFYSKKELYTSANYWIHRQTSDFSYPEGFYNYRDSIAFGSKKLRSYYPYYRYLNLYCDNIAYAGYKDEARFNRNSYLHLKNKLTVIDSLITDEGLKNNLLRTNVSLYLLNEKNAKHGNAIVNQFLKLSTVEEDHKEILRLANTSMLLTPNSKIPAIKVRNINKEVVTLQDIITKKTVFYFWSSESIKHYRNIHFQAKELQKKFPQYNFIAINTDSNFSKWETIIENASYNTKYEFQFKNPKEGEHKLLLNSMNKAIIVDHKGYILDSHTGLFNSHIENELKKHLKK